MIVDKNLFRQTLGQFATGITIVSTKVDERCFGFTANSFTSVSMVPPIVLFCVKKESTFVEHLSLSKKFSVSVLADDHREISNLFADPSVESEVRYQMVSPEMSPLGNPIIAECLTWIDCTLMDVLLAGDHYICTGAVVHMCEEQNEKSPLIYFKGHYNTLA